MSASPLVGGRRGAPAFGREMPVRIASAAVLAAVALGCAWFGGWPAGAAVAVAVIVVHLEWIGLTADDLRFAIASTVLLVAAFAVLVAGYPRASLAVAAGAVVLAAILSREAWRPLGVLYGAVLGLGMLLLRTAPEHGFVAILFLFAVVWGTDTGAFFAGRIIGGPKLWPAVSPKKTWAGSAGGLAVGLAAGLAVAAVSGVAVTPGLALVAAALSAASQLGDLFESSVKRRFGVKDASQLVPGHGGLMDRVDGLVFAAGLAALIGWLHGGPYALAGGLLTW